jgi:hypothetical protein
MQNSFYFCDLYFIFTIYKKNYNKMYRKLKRTWSHNDANYIPKFRETFPELNKISSEEMCDR